MKELEMLNFRNLVIVSLPLLAGCSLFHSTPDSVIEGQRTVYTGLQYTREHIELIVDRYVKDNKAAVTYHINFVYEPRIEEIRLDPSLSREQKSTAITILETERDNKLEEAFASIDRIGDELRDPAIQNLDIVVKMVGSIYDYMSTTPISVDSLPFWIEQLNRLRDQDS